MPPTRCTPPTTTEAGVLIGQYAKRGARRQARPKIATLDLLPGHPVGAQRHNGFLKGFGLRRPRRPSNELGKAGRGRVHGRQLSAIGRRDRRRWKTASRRIPTSTSSTRSTSPTAAGAFKALKRAGKEKDVVLVSVDGGCQGIKNVGAGVIAATAQQYPAEDGGAGRRCRRRVRQDGQEGQRLHGHRGAR